MTRPAIDVIENALIAMIQDDASYLTYIPDNQVQSFEQGVDLQSMEIILTPPGVLVMYESGSYAPLDINRSSYSIDERFTLIAVASNLRGMAEAKLGSGTEKGVYDILEDLKRLVVHNRRLAISASTDVTLIFLSVMPFENLFYRTGFAAYGLQIKVQSSSWEYRS